MDTTPSKSRDLSALARELVKLGPAPAWVAACDYDSDFKPKSVGPLTYLLIERQVHAESFQTYVRMAMRLETAQAVQHESQWRLEFEPQSQSVVLHSIKTRRGSAATEHGVLANFRFLQREAGLEGFVVDGWVTLLLVLEDVRPGDVLEWSYTITTQPRLLPEYIHQFFALPAGVEVGGYHFSIRHAERRSLRWKSSSPELAPASQTEGGEVRCFWAGERLSSPEPENCSPAWQLTFPWIQVSDCPDWQTVARAVCAAWREGPAEEALACLTDEIRSFSPDLMAQVDRAIETVQDGFRYLSVNLELGGQIPVPAETVIRRRYGDCKDLAWLLVRLLRSLGVPARPVLVNGSWTRAIGDLLPSAGLFNHAVVEFELGTERRWVDATLKCQGGGALKRCVPDFGLGLPLDDASMHLVPVPASSLPTAAWEAKESLVLDTTGHASQILVTTRAKGFHADELRWQFANQGADTIAKNRLQACANRFCKAMRLGQLQHQDDRKQNEFVITEAFEIEGFLKRDPASGRCVLTIHSDVTAGMLSLPSEPARRHPFALPFPCNRVHTFEIESAALKGLSLPPSRVGNHFFTFSRFAKSLPNFLEITFTLDVLSDCVPAGQALNHRLTVESACQEATLQLLLPRGYPRRSARIDLRQFTAAASASIAARNPSAAAESAGGKGGGSWLLGKLDERRRARAAAQAADSGTPPAQGEPDVAGHSAEQSSHRKSSSRHARRRGRANKKCLWSLWVFVGAIAAFVTGALLWPTHSGAGIAALLFLLVIPAVPGSLALAVLGIRECGREPHRYTGGKGIALSVLVAGTLFGLMLIPGVLSGVQRALAGASVRSERAAGHELLRFEAHHFVFHSPPRPWVQADAKPFGRSAVVAFLRPGTIGFVASVHPVEAGVPDARSRTVEACKAGIRSWTTSYRLVSEGGVSHAGLAGWQMETEANSQGHDNFYVHWLFVTNELGYELATYGPVSLKTQIREEAERMCSSFEWIAPTGGQP